MFDKNKRLISVPGAAGFKGNHYCNGSLTRDLHKSGRLRVRFYSNDGYDPESILNGTNRKRSYTGSGYRHGTYDFPGGQGGSTFVDQRYKSKIKQNTQIPQKGDFTVPFITIKLL